MGLRTMIPTRDWSSLALVLIAILVPQQRAAAWPDSRTSLIRSFVQQGSIGPRHFGFAPTRKSDDAAAFVAATAEKPQSPAPYDSSLAQCSERSYDEEKLALSRCELLERIAHLEKIVSSVLRKSLETNDEAVPNIPLNLIAKMKRKNEFIRFGKRSGAPFTKPMMFSEQPRELLRPYLDQLLVAYAEDAIKPVPAH